MAPVKPAAPDKQALRNALRHRRHVIPADLRSTTQWKVQNYLRTLIADMAPTVVGFYAAQDDELDLMPLVTELWRDGQTVALPRVIERNHPLVFNIWPAFGPTEADLLGIQAALGPEILPRVLIIPCVGYTREGYRLGGGGGYYDRTLASLAHPCRTIGVAFTELELPATFKPEAHDVKLDFIVTGKEVIQTTPEKPKLPKRKKKL